MCCDGSGLCDVCLGGGMLFLPWFCGEIGSCFDLLVDYGDDD